MKYIKKYVLVLIALGVFLSIFTSVKSDEQVNAVVQYQMLACEKCDHFKVIRSNKLALTGELVIFVSNKDVLNNMLDFSIAQPNKTICAKGKLYLLDLSFDIINPKGKRFYLEGFSNENQC